MGSLVDLRKRATLLAQTATILSRNRGATAAAILLISGGSYSYYLSLLAAQAKKKKHKYVAIKQCQRLICVRNSGEVAFRPQIASTFLFVGHKCLPAELRASWDKMSLRLCCQC